LKLKLIVDYLNENKFDKVDKLLDDAIENPTQSGTKKQRLFLEEFVFKDVSKQAKLVFLYCCFMESTFISYELLGELFQREEDELSASLASLRRRGLLVETTDKSIGKEGEEEGLMVTHRCLQEEMRLTERAEIDRHKILARIGECLLAKNRLITCDRTVTRKRDGQRVDANFRQAKHLLAELSKVQLDKNERLFELFTEINEKLGYFYMFYEVNYAKALDCFKQVNKFMTKRNKKEGNKLGKTFFYNVNILKMYLKY
jgi:hypothetical protein